MDEALSKGTDVVLRIDVQGAKTVRQLMPQAVCIFLVRAPTGCASVAARSAAICCGTSMLGLHAE